MAITETRKKLTLTAFDIVRGRDKDTSPAPTITFARGKLLFSKGLVRELDLNTKFIKFYYDPVKLVIAFQVKDQLPFENLKGAGRWRKVTVSRFGNWTVSLTKMVSKTFGEEFLTKLIQHIPVQKYREQNDIINRGEVYYFIELNNHESDVQDTD